MLWLAVGIAALFLFKLLEAWLSANRRRAEATAYRAAGNLLTPAEQKFWLVLKQCLPPTVMACPKVRLIDVLEPKKGDHSARGGVIAKHLDFVLADVMTTRVVGAIELDDSSHSRRARRDRDDFVDRALEHAGVPILRVTCARNYDARELGEQVRSLISSKVMRLSA